MKKIISRRVIAFLLDYLLIAVYAMLLFGIARILKLGDLALTPISGQILGFISLTLPVFLYFFLLEKGSRRATLGKRIMGIFISAQSDNSQPNILQRNLLKFLPWEMAHTGVHWIAFYSKHEINVPIWVWFLLLVPQFIMLMYFGSIIVSKGESSLYDKIANTNIEMK